MLSVAFEQNKCILQKLFVTPTLSWFGHIQPRQHDEDFIVPFSLPLSSGMYEDVRIGGRPENSSAAAVPVPAGAEGARLGDVGPSRCPCTSHTKNSCNRIDKDTQLTQIPAVRH